MRAALVVVALAACTPYSDDYGAEPFFCGNDNPRCPDGYVCVQDQSSGMNVCMHSAGSGSGSFQCADDSALEPNDTFAGASATGLDAMASYQHDNLAICPSSDIDNFSLTLAAPANVTAIISFDPTASPLQVEILNMGNIPVATLSPVPDMPASEQATSTNLPTGTYYVQVHVLANGGLDENNYSLSINLTTP